MPVLTPAVLEPAFGDFLYNPADKRIYTDEGKPVGASTYERPLFKPPWYNFWTASRYLNPSHYATDATALRIEKWAQANFAGVTFTIEENWDVYGTITSPELLLVAASGLTGVSENFNAGLLAFGLDKNGPEWQKQSFRAELKTAHVLA